MSKKKALITGASGYLGARLCRSLLQDSYAVRALVRPTSDLTDLRSTISSTSSSSNDDDSDGIGSSLEISYGDITDLHSLLSAFSGCDVVFHTASLVELWFPDSSCFSKALLVICYAFLDQGHDVRAFVQPGTIQSSDEIIPPTKSNLGEGSLEVAYGDLTDFASLLDAPKDCDTVFHVAALVEGWLPDLSLFFSVNVEGLKNVIQACKETDSVKKIIYTSSFFAIGSTDGYVADESQLRDRKYFCTEYERSKAIADEIALEAASDGLPIVIVYPGVIYGPGKITAGNLVARLMIERFNGRLPGYMGSGTDKVSFSHVEDVAAGQIAAMHKGRVGERYLLTGDNASMASLFDVAAILTKTRKPWFHIPLWVLEIYGYISVLVARITGKLPLVCHHSVRVLKHQWAYSCDKAKRELDYRPRSLNEGLAETLSWLKNMGLIKY